MTRGLTAGVETLLDGVEVVPIVLVDLDTESGPVRVWSGVGDLTFQSNVYSGTGTLGSISTVEETVRLEALGARLTLSGVPTLLISKALQDMRQSRICTIWLAFFNVETFSIVADATEIFVGFTDQVEIVETGETSTISINVENKLVRFKTKIERSFTNEDQQADHAADLGMEYVAGLVDTVFDWR